MTLEITITHEGHTTKLRLKGVTARELLERFQAYILALGLERARGVAFLRAQ